MTSNTMLYSLLSRVEALEKALLDPPGECAPGFDPDDPLSEVVPYNHESPDVSSYHHLEVVQRLQRMDEPRTIRNLLREYMRDSVCGQYYTIKSPTTGALFCIHRLNVCSMTSPRGIEYDNVYTTPHFSVASGVGISSLIGWTIKGEYKVLDAFEDCGHKYLITELI